MLDLFLKRSQYFIQKQTTDWQKQTTDWIDALIESIKLGQHNETMFNEIKTCIETRIGDDPKFIGKVIEKVKVMQTESQERSTTAQPTSQPSSPLGEERLGGGILGKKRKEWEKD